MAAPPNCEILYRLDKEKGNYVQLREGRLVGRVQVHDDVDRCDQDFSEDEYDHDPFEQFSLKIVSRC